MSKRNIFAELIEGIHAMPERRAGKRALPGRRVEATHRGATLGPPLHAEDRGGLVQQTGKKPRTSG